MSLSPNSDIGDEHYGTDAEFRPGGRPRPLMICTVLRSGGDYDARYVAALRRQVEQFAPAEPWGWRVHTDMLDGAVALTQGWPGWWSKMEVFAPVDSDRLYLDLDTLVVGPLQPLVDAARAAARFVCLRDFYRPDGYGTGLMWLPAGWGAHVYNKFRGQAAAMMQRFGGDQNLLEAAVPHAALWQDIAPGRVVSYKPLPIPGAFLAAAPAGASVICFHGRPRPHELAPDNWAARLWRGETAA